MEMVRLALVAVTGVPGATVLLPMLEAPEQALHMSIQQVIALRATHCRITVRDARVFGARWGKRKNITHLDKGIWKDARAEESLGWLSSSGISASHQPMARRGAETYEHPRYCERSIDAIEP
jgi:hypothetical protein